jgi:hypothetical protein
VVVFFCVVCCCCLHSSIILEFIFAEAFLFRVRILEGKFFLRPSFLEDEFVDHVNLKGSKEKEKSD